MYWGDSKIVTVKEINGNTETLTRFRGSKKIMQRTADFEITHVGGLNIFTYQKIKNYFRTTARGKRPFFLRFKNSW